MFILSSIVGYHSNKVQFYIFDYPNIHADENFKKIEGLFGLIAVRGWNHISINALYTIITKKTTYCLFFGLNEQVQN